MEHKKGIKYIVDGHKDLNDFALGILALTNIKSQYEDVIVDIKTFYDSNQVYVTCYANSGYNIESYIEAHMGSIVGKDEVIITSVWNEDFKNSVDEELTRLEDDYFENDGKEFVVLYQNFL